MEIYFNQYGIIGYNVNIETVDLPYTLKPSERSVEWYDDRIDLII